MFPVQDSDIGRIVRRIGRPDGTNIVALRKDRSYRPLSAEEALIQWMLDLPTGAAIDKAARYALRVVDAGPAMSPDVQLFCDYLRQAIEASQIPVSPNRRRRRRQP
ncbi:hypothetical protein [Hoeflea prorocentri]|uniref:Uncharacterized protein n=1 Tax=Hoeflea prorocentri TaxID=1922333 RepID=A0A9X3ZJ83_9HYPH|nr:hypothetical protein [Hoeflea prorocentri]MCY6383189.1 hypothetical protein [Hoeflea prorocentri]MDA5400989.1 hypothetical protein [Hoeflea prorocentri]